MMTPERYAALRSILGDRKTAARVLGCSESAVRLRESGHLPVSADAEARLLAAVEGSAHEHDAKRQERLRRIIERREERRGMTAIELEGALDALGWTTRREAAERLLGEARDAWRITAWALGRTIIPLWVARHLREHLGLAPDAPFPAPRSIPGHRRRRFTPTCLPRDFRHALHLLGWSQAVAAEQLGVANKYRVSDWCRGARAVPLYVELHLRTLLDIGPGEPWPTRRPDLVLPNFIHPPVDSGRTS